MRTVALLPVLAIAFLAAAGCGGSSEATTSTTTTTTETGLGPPGSGTTPAAPGGVRTKTCTDESLDSPEVVVIGGSCGQGKQAVAGWEAKGDCYSPAGASRFACTVGKLRCQGLQTERGIAVNCARPQLSISFLSGRG
jgi:hypothetical protein